MKKIGAAVLQPFVDRHTLAGAVVVVASPDKVLDLEAVGFADIAAKKPMKKDALFWIASMTKPITGTAVMMLADEGKVHMDDPVAKYLPGFKDQMVVVEQDKDHVLLKRPVHTLLLRHIMSHTGGMVPRSPLEPHNGSVPLRDVVASYSMMPLKFEPGSRYEYSNAGINTAGRIVELVSGMTFDRFLDERLFKPLGMKDTTFWPSARQLKRLAKAYKPDAANTGLEETAIAQFAYPLTDRARGVYPAGGLFSTAADCARFCRMILSGGVFAGKRYLSEKAVKEMTSSQTGDLPTGYGFGWSADKNPGGGFGHGGAYSTNMHINPQRRLVTVFMVQHAGWPNDGKDILPKFMKAAAEAFAPAPTPSPEK